MKIFFLAVVSIIIFCHMTFAQNDSPKGFAIYRLPENIKPSQLSKFYLKKLKPSGKPLIETSDISSYLKDRHEIRFNYSGTAKLNKAKKALKGKAFAVFVDGVAIYTGAFWSNIYSQSLDGVYIALEELADDFPVAKLKLGYPTEKFFTGATDPRSDKRVFNELEKAGILYEELEVKGICKKIRATGKRHQSWFFTFSLDSTVKGNYPNYEITFEKYADFGGIRLLTLLEAFDETSRDTSPESSFNRNKAITLVFEVQIKAMQPRIISVDFKDQ